MRARAGVTAIAILLVCGFGWSQSSKLGEVAGSIKLDPSAIVQSDGGVAADPGRDREADRQLLTEVLSDCDAAAARIEELAREARTTIYDRDSTLDLRVEDAALVLEAAARDLYLLRLGKAFDEPLDAAHRAAEACESVVEAVQSELARRSVIFSQAGERVAACRTEIAAAEARLEAVGSNETVSAGEGSSAGSGEVDEPAEPPTAAERIAAFCRIAGAGDQNAFTRCEDRQFRALAAIEARSAISETLDEAVFSDIREACELDHPDDLVALDLCEQEKMTAARLEVETGQP